MADVVSKSGTVCFTGHRLIECGEDELAGKLDVVIDRCVEKGYRRFLTGGALGFDTLAAKRVVAAKERHPEISLSLILPCRDQTKLWKKLPDIREYSALKDVADEVVYVQNFYDQSCMMKRNRLMVDSSGLCIAYFNGRPGGTGNTVEYAKNKGVPTVNLYTEKR